MTCALRNAGHRLGITELLLCFAERFGGSARSFKHKRSCLCVERYRPEATAPGNQLRQNLFPKFVDRKKLTFYPVFDFHHTRHRIGERLV